MEFELVNSGYIQELQGITEDQQEFDLLPQMFERLIAGRDEFLVQYNHLLQSDREQIGFQLHKLKNQFANLGCEAVSYLLEDMYQDARNHHFDKVSEKLAKLRTLSDQTFLRLKSELSH